MKSYTVIYIESYMVGSHKQTLVYKKIIEGNSYDAAIQNSTVYPASVVYAFHGACENVQEGD